MNRHRSPRLGRQAAVGAGLYCGPLISVRRAHQPAQPLPRWHRSPTKATKANQEYNVIMPKTKTTPWAAAKITEHQFFADYHTNPRTHCIGCGVGAPGAARAPMIHSNMIVRIVISDKKLTVVFYHRPRTPPGMARFGVRARTNMRHVVLSRGGPSKNSSHLRHAPAAGTPSSAQAGTALIFAARLSRRIR